MPNDRLSVQRLPKSRVICTVTFTQEEITPAEEKALRAFEPQLKIDGFRTGHAPLDMIKPKVPADALFEEIIRVLLRDALPSIIRDEKLSPIVPPKVEAQSREPLTIAITFVEKPEVTIKNHDTLTVEKKPLEVDPKDVEKVVASVLAEHKTKASADRAAAKGDDVLADFHATDEAGVEIPGLKAVGYDISIGSDTLLPGFEEQVIGLKKGDKKTFTLTLPEKFADEKLRNKPATFHLTVNDVFAVTMPELTDAFAKEKLNAESADAFRTMVKESIGQQEASFLRMERERKLMEEIQKRTTAEVADELLEEEVRGMIQEWAQRLEQQGTTIADALQRQNKKPEDVEKEMREEAAKRWKLRLGLAKLIELKGITVDEKELTEAFGVFRSQLPAEEQPKADDEWTKRGNLFEEIRWRTLVEKMVEGMLA